MERINNEYYVSFEISKLLKELGFDWECEYEYSEYTEDENHEINLIEKQMRLDYGCHETDYTKYYSAPTLEVAQRWLRDVKNCYVSIVADCDSVGVFYTTRIIYYDTDNNYHATYVWEEIGMECVQVIFNNYEETQEACIKKTLKIILEGGE